MLGWTTPRLARAADQETAAELAAPGLAAKRAHGHFVAEALPAPSRERITIAHQGGLISQQGPARVQQGSRTVHAALARQGMPSLPSAARPSAGRPVAPGSDEFG